MTNPFPTSGYRGPSYFCDREKEVAALMKVIKGGGNVTLFSIRRMGKTALVHHFFNTLAQDKNRLAIYLDAMPTSDLKGLTNQLATAVAQAYPESTPFGKKLWQWIKTLRPLISFDAYSGLPQLSFDVGQMEQQQSTIRNVLQFLEASGKKVVIAIDEFQQITRYPEKQTEAWLRSEIQSLQNVNFIFCGSQQHLLLEMFNSAKRPFYASTQMFPIHPIEVEPYAVFIAAHFKQARMEIKQVDIRFILEWCRLHTFYVQAVCGRVYLLGERKITREAIQAVISNLFKENLAIYFTYREMLTESQWALLKAIAKEGRVYAPTAMGFIQRHRLGTPAAVKRSLESLLAKEMIFRENSGAGSYLQVYDLFLSRWLETQ